MLLLFAVPAFISAAQAAFSCDQYLENLQSCADANHTLVGHILFGPKTIQNPSTVGEVCKSGQKALQCFESVLKGADIRKLSRECPKCRNIVEVFVQQRFLCSPEGQQLFVGFAKSSVGDCALDMPQVASTCYATRSNDILSKHKVDLALARKRGKAASGGTLPEFPNKGSELIYLASIHAVDSSVACEVHRMNSRCDAEAMGKLCGKASKEFHLKYYEALEVVSPYTQC